MNTKSNLRQNRRKHYSSNAVPILPMNHPRKIPPIINRFAEVLLEAHLKNFDCFAEKMLMICQPEGYPFIKSAYLLARQKKQFQWCLDEMDSPEAVRNYDLEKKINELQAANGPLMAPNISLLEPGEILMSAPFLILTPENRIPQNFSEALEGLKALWKRELNRMQKIKLDLRRLEATLNYEIREQGGCREIRLCDESYLSLLDPVIMASPDWGPMPAKYIRTLEKCMRTPVTEITCPDPLNNMITVGKLYSIFHEPLRPPADWHFSEKLAVRQ